MEKCEQFTFPLSRHLFIPRQPIFEKVAVNFVVGITNLVGNSPFSLIVLWSLIKKLGEGSLSSLAIVSQNFPLELTVPSSLFPINSLRFQIGLPLSRVALGLPPSICGQIPSVYNLQSVLYLWSWSYLLERIQIRISSVFGECHRFPLFLHLFLDFSADNGNEDMPIQEFFGFSHALHFLPAVFQNSFLLRRITNLLVKVVFVLPL